MYNNEVTYSDHWDNFENREYQKKCEKFIYHTTCMSDIPLAWTKEVYELLTYLDKEFGIEYDLNFYYGLNAQFGVLKVLRSTWDIVISKPVFFREESNTFRNNLMHHVKKPWKLLKFFWNYMSRGAFVFKGMVYNKVKKPKIAISQIKEKYGELVIYFRSPEWLESHIEDLISDTEVKLAAKGAYYSLESFLGHSSTRRMHHHKEVEATKVTDAHMEIKDWTGRRALERAGYNVVSMLKENPQKESYSRYQVNQRRILEMLEPVFVEQKENDV